MSVVVACVYVMVGIGSYPVHSGFTGYVSHKVGSAKSWSDECKDKYGDKPDLVEIVNMKVNKVDSADSR